MNDKIDARDLGAGVALAELGDGDVLRGLIDGTPALMLRRGDAVFAVGAACSHYGASLARGLVCDGAIHCPRHHARFSLHTGEALTAPALDAIPCWQVERQGDRFMVVGRAAPRPTPAPPSDGPRAIVIVGGGAAAQAAAEMLRREGFEGRLTMLSAERSPPADRPNLSKSYLTGDAPDAWIPLRPPEFYAAQHIDLQLDARVARIDVARREVVTTAGATHPYDRLLLATGADPVRLRIPGAELPHIHYLRSYEDSRAILGSLANAARVVVLGASFIGLEVAASLRARGLEVHVAAPESRPLERVLGPELGDFVRALHEAHGVTFHLGRTASAIASDRVVLDDGTTLPADLVVAGIGVRPALTLAEAAGLAIDRGVLVDAFLETSAAGVFAAGDVARWPDPHSGRPIRVEHWVVAERHGQIAARNMLGRREPCAIVPFFWSRHYDMAIAYVGHAETWDHIELDGDLGARDCRVTYRQGGRTLAVATVGRERESLRAELELERQLVAAAAPP